MTEPFREERLGSAWPDVIHVGDCEIVPQATYEVRAVEVNSGIPSDPITIETTVRPANGVFAWWADCVGSLNSYCNGDYTQAGCADSSDCGGDPCLLAWEPPNGFTTFDDVNAVLKVFAAYGPNQVTPVPPGPLATPDVPDITWVDIHGADAGSAAVDPPEGIGGFSDVGFVVQAFGGRPYPYSDPADCPDVGAWP